MQHTLEFTARARHSDPETSREAAATIRGEKMTRAMQAVLLTLAPYNVALCDEEIVASYDHSSSVLPAQTPQSIRSRRATLVRLGYVRHVGHIVNRHGNRSRTWAITHAGRAYVDEHLLDTVRLLLAGG